MQKCILSSLKLNHWETDNAYYWKKIIDNSNYQSIWKKYEKICDSLKANCRHASFVIDWKKHDL